ncbi:MAG: NAD-dependent deacetylase [Halarsenatibacteraceae bacterium]
MEKEKIKQAAEMIEKADYPVVLTGAGISAESGVPTFRGKSGLWKKYDPEAAVSISGFRRDPEPFWNFAQELLLEHDVQPNPGHIALAQLEDLGLIELVITQNIDFLHQRSGSNKVLELHGTLNKATCLNCNKKYDWEDLVPVIKAGKIPECDNCKSSKIKPDIVFFGERLPEAALNQAWEAAERSDLMIVIGSSLAVYPVASLPAVTQDNGGKLIYINADSGQQDYLFDLIIQGKAGEILPEILKIIN